MGYLFGFEFHGKLSIRIRYKRDYKSGDLECIGKKSLLLPERPRKQLIVINSTESTHTHARTRLAKKSMRFKVV